MSMSILDQVRESTGWVCANSQHVKLNLGAMKNLAAEIASEAQSSKLHLVSETSSEKHSGAISREAQDEGVGWGGEIHYAGDEERVVQYLFVLDALNYCFWPSDGEWEYEDLSTALKRAVEADQKALEAPRLADMSEEALCALLGGKKMPNMAARAAHVRELGRGLVANWAGSAAAMVESCEGSAEKLVSSLVATFPGFQDHVTFKGRQIFFYKRAQILAADIWGALKGQGVGAMADVDKLTMFADYRVPQLLEARGVLEYSFDLKQRVLAMEELPQGGDYEVEIRAWTVQSVERLKQELVQAFGLQTMSIKIDWYLWEQGEKQDRAGSLPPHHRTRTTFY